MYDLLIKGYFLEAFLFAIAAILSIMLHEVAHGYMAIKNGDLTPKYAGRMNLNPIRHFDLLGFALFIFVGFGWARPVPVNPNNFRNYRRGLFQVSIAGVALNFILAFFSYPLASLFFYADGIIFEVFNLFFKYMFILNLSLCVFNLLPVYPLDGFRIIESKAGYGNPYVNFMYRYGLYVFIGFILFINYTSFNILYVINKIIGLPIILFWSLFGL